MRDELVVYVTRELSGLYRARAVGADFGASATTIPALLQSIRASVLAYYDSSPEPVPRVVLARGAYHGPIEMPED